MSLDIKNIYNDALYWATSPQSKDKGYHISRVHDSVLRKLIHYCKNKERVFFTNDIIASHIYLGEEQVKKSIPLLEKKGFIKCLHISTRDENNNIIKRRGISINWPTFEKIMDELPAKKAKLDEEIDDVIQVEMPIQNSSENLIESEINDSLEYDLTGIIEVDDTESDATEIELNDEVAVEVVKYRVSDKISIMKFIFELDFDDGLLADLMIQIREENDGEDLIQLGLMLKYISQFIKEQKYNDYRGVVFTPEIIEAINAKVIR